jgi:hypothetical protein
MDEIQSPRPEIKIRTVNFKTNINIDSKTQAVQNINFQEILNNASGQQAVEGISSQNSSINLDSLNKQGLNPEESGNPANEKNPLHEKNTTTSVKVALDQDPHTTLFSQFNPQKPVNIKEKSFNFTNLLHSEPENDKNGLVNEKNTKKKIIRQTPEIIKSETTVRKEHSKKSEEKGFYESDTYKDSFSREAKRQDINNDNSTKIIKTEMNPLLIPAEAEQKFADEQKKRRSRNQENSTETEISTEEEFIAEVNKIIDGYGLKKHPSNLSRADGDNQDYNLWLKSLIFGAREEPLTVKESDILAKYITRDEKVSFTDKEILTKLLSDIFKHQIISLNPNLVTRLEKNAVELISRAFPSVILNGFIKKTVIEIEKGRHKASLTSAIYKMVNGERLTEAEVIDISALFHEDFAPEERETLKNIFSGYYHQDELEKIKQVIGRLAGSGNLPPGFTGCFYEIFLELIENEHYESVRQILKILEVYGQGNDFSVNEIKIIASLIARKYFSSKLIDNNKVAEIIGQLVSGQKVDYMTLELLTKITGKSLLSYLPARLDEEVSYFLRYLPFTDNEVKYQGTMEGHSVPEFCLGGKIKVSGIAKLGRKYNVSLILANRLSEKETEITPEKNSNFKKIIEIGSYQLKSLKLAWENKQIIIALNNDITIFNVDSGVDIFYYGALKVFLDPEDLSVQKLSLKNDYSGFLDYYKKTLKLSVKDKIIKINSKLFNKK